MPERRKMPTVKVAMVEPEPGAPPVEVTLAAIYSFKTTLYRFREGVLTYKAPAIGRCSEHQIVKTGKRARIRVPVRRWKVCSLPGRVVREPAWRQGICKRGEADLVIAVDHRRIKSFIFYRLGNAIPVARRETDLQVKAERPGDLV